jgi:anti-sigma-K factor RskA
MRDLVEDYALGVLDDAARATFEQRLEVDAALRQEVAAAREALGALALSMPIAPVPELKDRVMQRIAATTSAPVQPGVLPFERSARPSRAPLWLGVALAASMVLVFRLAISLRDARSDAADARSAADNGRRTLAQRDSLIAQLTDPATETVTLAATGAAKPVIKAYVNRVHRTMMLSAGLLDTLPAGRAYQLWFIVDGKPVPSVTFRPDSTGRALLRDLAMPAGAVAATAITDEPAAGSTAPTTPILFVAKLTTE